MSELIALAFEWLVSLAVIAAAIVWTVTLLRMRNTSEQGEGFIIGGGAASEMAKRIKAKQEEERRRRGSEAGIERDGG